MTGAQNEESGDAGWGLGIRIHFYPLCLCLCCFPCLERPLALKLLAAPLSVFHNSSNTPLYISYLIILSLLGSLQLQGGTSSTGSVPTVSEGQHPGP